MDITLIIILIIAAIATALASYFLLFRKTDNKAPPAIMNAVAPGMSPFAVAPYGDDAGADTDDDEEEEEEDSYDYSVDLGEK